MYEIFEQKNGRKVGIIDGKGRICCPDPLDQRRLETFFSREILFRESEDGRPEIEPLLEETMCFFAIQTLAPSDPQYLTVAIGQLPLLTPYAVRPI